MFRFISTREKEELNQRYLEIFKQRKSMNKKYKSLIDSNSDLAGIIPVEYQTIEKLLIAPFDILAKIYFDYVDYVNSLDAGNADAINDTIRNVFNYASHSKKIGQFLLNPENLFPVHNCIYCDLIKVNGYTEQETGNRVREFETEHILDKGNCPLVSLSLYNFAPSCTTCNGQIHKGRNTLGRTIEETILLSPTTKKNKFAEEVRFTVLPLTSEIRDLIMFKSDDELGIDFKGETEKYNRTIDMFKLRDRYNARKANIFETLEKMRMWSVNLGRKYPISSEDKDEMFELVFGFNRRALSFEPMEKCRRDIFEEHFGKISD